MSQRRVCVTFMVQISSESKNMQPTADLIVIGSHSFDAFIDRIVNIKNGGID